MPSLTDEQLLALATGPESDRVERTTSETSTDKFGEAICAFANDLPGAGQPGYLYIGVDDSGQVQGVRNAAAVEQLIASLRDNGNILPPPTLSIRRVQTPHGEVVAVEALPCDRPPVRFQGRTMIRVEARRAIATIDDERRLSERAIDSSRTWDLRPRPDATLDNLALDLFTLAYLPLAVSKDALVANGRSVSEQLAALRLFDPRADAPTNGAVLLFGKDPVWFFPGAYVQYVSYDGPSRADPVLEARRFAGDLISIMRGLDELAQQLAVPRPVRQPDMTDRTIFEYPPIALHELFMNAVIHRNYDGTASPILINQHSDRLEIVNPGSLYGGLSALQVRSGSGTAYRNPVLAEAARVLGRVNRFGRGIAIAQAELDRNSSPVLVLDPSEHFFTATVWARR